MTKPVNYLVKILKLATPVAGSNLISTLTASIGVIMLAHLSHAALAASALISATQMTIVVTGMSVLFSISVLVGHAYGAKQYEDIGGIVQQGWLLGLFICVPVMLLLWFIKPILLLLHQPLPLVDLVQDYFHAYLWGMPATLGLVGGMQFALGILKRGIVVIISSVSIFITTILGYGLIFGKLGLPALGVAGLGYAIVVQTWSMFIGLMIYFYYHEQFKIYTLFRWRIFDSIHLLSKLFRIGWPISVQMAGELLSFFVSTLMAGWLGLLALGARQISLQYLMVTVMLLFAISQAVSILVGHAVGAKQLTAIKQLGNKAVLLGIVVAIFVLLVYLAIPKLLIALFVNVNTPAAKPLLDLTAILFIVVGIGQVFDGIRNIYTGALRGLLDTRFPMVVGLICIWLIAIPLGYYMAFNLRQGIVGLSVAYDLALAIAAGVLWWRWHTKIQ